MGKAEASRYPNPRCQRGAALIVALLILAVTVLLATTLGHNFFLIFKRAENQSHSQQAYTYLLAVEGVARAALLLDVQNPIDTLYSEWHRPQQFPTDYGSVQGQLSDLQGRFNLNNLAITSDDNVHQQRFIRLLQLVDVEPAIDISTAQAITEAVSEWLRSNDSGLPDPYYSDTEPYTRAAHRPMIDVSVLRLVKGISNELYLALRPHIGVWPIEQASHINVNTANVLVLRSLNVNGNLEPLADSIVQLLLEQREQQQGFATVDDFVSALSGTAIDANGLGVDSDYFLLYADTEFSTRRFMMYSVIYRSRENSTATVIARSPSIL